MEVSVKSIPVAEPSLTEREIETALECLRSGWISSKGKFVEQFERDFATFCQTKYGLATSNGTTALHLALIGLGIGPGDEVIVPTLTFIATANAVHYTGATAVLVDVEPTTWCIDPAQVAAAITPRTKAIIPVHLYGHPANMTALCEIAARHGLAIVEDAAEAHGARADGRPVGGLGTVGCFSFYGNKIFTTGEGGMVVTNDTALVARMVRARDHGMDPTRHYWHPEIGYNYRMTNLQAAIGVAQLARAPEILHRKRDIADRYRALLTDVPGITLPPEASWAYNAYWMFSILLEESAPCTRDELRSQLAGGGIETRPFFYPLHQMPPYATATSYPVAETLARRGINLPSSVTLADHDVRRVATAVRDALGER